MYGIVLLAAMTTGGESADFGGRKCSCSCTSCSSCKTSRKCSSCDSCKKVKSSCKKSKKCDCHSSCHYTCHAPVYHAPVVHDCCPPAAPVVHTHVQGMVHPIQPQPLPPGAKIIETKPVEAPKVIEEKKPEVAPAPKTLEKGKDKTDA